MSRTSLLSLKNRTRWIFCLVVLCCFAQDALSQKGYGGEIYYTHISGSKYHIVTVLYWACILIPPNLPNLEITDGTTSNNYTVTYASATYDTIGIPPGQCTRCTDMSCSFPYGFQFRSYYADVDLSTFSGCSLSISFSICCYFGSITTGAAGQGIYISTTLNRCKEDLGSPVFNQPPIMMIYANKTIDQYQSATPSRINDSVAYKLIPPMSDSKTKISYNKGYDYNYPFIYEGESVNAPPDASKPEGFHYDSLSGEIYFKPQISDVSLIAIEADEYAKDTSGTWYVAGTTTRNMVTICRSFNNNKNDPGIAGIYGAKSDTSVICAGVPLTFQIKTFDRGNIHDTLSVSILNETTGTISHGTGLQPTLTFNWTPPNTAVRPQPYHLIISVFDDATPMEDMVQRQFYIVVKDSVPNVSIAEADSGCGKYYFIANAKSQNGLTYKWYADSNLIAGRDTAVFTAPFNGKHIIKLQATNILGCTWDFYDTLHIHILPNVSASGGKEICVGGSAELTAKGGLKYTWSPSTGLNADTGAIVIASPITPTVYSVSGTDAEGCRALDTVKVIADTIHITLNTDTTICLGSIAHIRASSIHAAAYSWANTTNTLMSDSAGMYFKLVNDTNYYLTVKDTFGCTRTIAGVIHADRIKPNAGKPVSVCLQDSVQLRATGGTNYSWTPTLGLYNSLTRSDPYVRPPHNMEYNVTITDKYGCMAKDSVLVIVSNIPSYNLNPLYLCQGDSVQISAPMGKSYSWTPANSVSNPYINNPYVKPSATTTYKVIVCDTFCGCKANDSVLIFVNPSPKISAGTNQDICAGQTVVIGSVPQSGISYVLKSSDNLYFSYKSRGSVQPAVTTRYYLTAQNDTTGCRAKDSVTLTVNTVSAAFTGNQTVCQNDTMSYQATNYFINQTYSWAINGGHRLFLGNGYIIVAWDSLRNNSIRLIAALPGKCSDTLSEAIYVYPNPLAHITADKKICLGNAALFTDSAGTGSVFHWYFGDHDSSLVQNTVHTYRTPGFYHVSLLATSGQCTGHDTTNVQVFALPYRHPLISHTGFRQYNMDNNDSAGLTSYWKTGDGDSIPSNSIMHTYTDTGTYTLIFSDSYPWGCPQVYDTTIHVADIVPQPPPVYKDTVYLSPNPFVDHFVVDLSHIQAENIQVSLFDAIGRRIVDKQINNQAPGHYTFTIHLTPAQQRDGVYLLRYQAGDKVMVFKVVKL